jgi:hypothetical protein
MENNIDKVLARGEKLQNLEENARLYCLYVLVMCIIFTEELEGASSAFEKKSKALEKNMCLRRYLVCFLFFFIKLLFFSYGL